MLAQFNEAFPHANASGWSERGLISDLVLISTEGTCADSAQCECVCE